LKNEPFALIGIDTDSNLEQFKTQVKKQNITWRNSWQGSTGGPLCRDWGIGKFPTIYVLDGKGVIRFIDLRDQDLGNAVDKLLAEMKKK